MVETLTVQEALNKLKILDKRINSFNSKLLDLTDARQVIQGFNSKSDFIKFAKSELTSIKDLIKYRNKLKSAIIISNANTNISVAGCTMSLAEAIERKNSIKYDEFLLNNLKVQLVNVEKEYNKFNKTQPEDMKELLKVEFVDPINIREEIKKMSEFIDTFKSTVDTEITKSNVLTIININ